MLTILAGSEVTAVFSKRYESPEHAAYECVDDEQCLAVTCTDSFMLRNTDNTPAGSHCRMVTRKPAVVNTRILDYAAINAKGFCMDRKLHRGVVRSPKVIRLSVEQRSGPGATPMTTGDGGRLTAWQKYIAGDFERMDNPGKHAGIYYWGRPVYKRITGHFEWDYIQWNSLKMHWELKIQSKVGYKFTDYCADCSWCASSQICDGYDQYSPGAAIASDAAFPTSGRWAATGFPSATPDHNGFEHVTVTTIDDTPPDVCGDGEKQASEQCDDGNLLPGDGCSPVCTTDTVDQSLSEGLVTEHLAPSYGNGRRRQQRSLMDRLGGRNYRQLKQASLCPSGSKDTDGDGTPDCLDQCPYDPNAQVSKDCPVKMDVEADRENDRLLVSVEHATATEIQLEVRFGIKTAFVGPVAPTSRTEAGAPLWSLSVHTPGWHTMNEPFTVRAKTFTDGLPSEWSNGICSRPGDIGCKRA